MMKLPDLIKFTDLNKTTKIKLALLILASLVLAAILLSGRKGAHKPERVKNPVATAKTVTGKTEKLKPGKTREKDPAEMKELLRGVGRSDPFLRPDERSVSGGLSRLGLKLSGIVKDGNRTLAIINGAFIGEGETIDGKKIIRIEEKSVLVSESGKEYTIRMGWGEGK